MPDALGNEPRLIVCLKLPAKYWRDGRALGIYVSKSCDHDKGAVPTKGSSNATQVFRDVEVLNGLIGAQRQKLDFDGENQNPFRKTKASSIWETDPQHYRRLSFYFDAIEGVKPSSQDTTDGSIMFDKSSGTLWYRRSTEAKWERAVLRDEISEVENGRGHDAENLEHGMLNGDLTCFSSSKRRPSNRAQSSFPVGNLRYDGVVVIDYGLSPVRAFREFPLVLSSEYTGASMLDAQLQNSAIMLQDFRARMPPVIQQRIGGELALKPLYSIEIINARVLKILEATVVPTTAYSITSSEESPEATIHLSGTHNKTSEQSMTKDHDRLVEGKNAIMQQDRRLTRSAPPDFLPEDENDARNLTHICA